MTHPTSLRLPEQVKDRLGLAATRTHDTPSAVAVRLIDEGLRMADHPGDDDSAWIRWLGSGD